MNRLHILQRFHNYLHHLELPEAPQAQWSAYQSALQRAYEDFLHSDARTEKVLSIYQRQAGVAFVDPAQIGR